VREDLRKEKDLNPGSSTLTRSIHDNVLPATIGRSIFTTVIFELDLIEAFLKTRVRSIIFITLPKVYGGVFPEFKKYCVKPEMLVKAVYETSFSCKYWYAEFNDLLDTCPILFTRKEDDDTLLISLIVYIEDCQYVYTSADAIEKD
jgi:hypothetical protein